MKNNHLDQSSDELVEKFVDPRPSKAFGMFEATLVADVFYSVAIPRELCEELVANAPPLTLAVPRG
jgi:hypothetical protein